MTMARFLGVRHVTRRPESCGKVNVGQRAYRSARPCGHDPVTDLLYASTRHRVVAVPSSPNTRSSRSRPQRRSSSSSSAEAPGVGAVAGRSSRPPAVWVVVALVWAEGLAATAAAVALVLVVIHGTQLVAASAALAVLAVGLALVLAGAGRALLRGRRWARSPVITMHVLVVAMSLASWRTAPAPWPAVGVALGVVVIGALLLPSVVGWTGSSGSADSPTAKVERGSR